MPYANELLLAELKVYEFSDKSSKSIHSYLTIIGLGEQYKQNYSTWTELLQDAPQRSVLGPILLNIYLNDLFFSLITHPRRQIHVQS